MPLYYDKFAVYMFISLYFSCPHKHVYNGKILARRTIYGEDYIDEIRIVAAALNIWENNNIFIF